MLAVQRRGQGRPHRSARCESRQFAAGPAERRQRYRARRNAVGRGRTRVFAAIGAMLARHGHRGLRRGRGAEYGREGRHACRQRGKASKQGNESPQAAHRRQYAIPGAARSLTRSSRLGFRRAGAILLRQTEHGTVAEAHRSMRVCCRQVSDMSLITPKMSVSRRHAYGGRHEHSHSTKALRRRQDRRTVWHRFSRGFQPSAFSQKSVESTTWHVAGKHRFKTDKRWAAPPHEFHEAHEDWAPMQTGQR